MSTSIKTKLIPIFARHETFHPRFGWFKKGFDKSIENPELFSEESAPSILGVGKNMVKAIRYWCLAYKLIQEDNDNKGNVNSTDFGKQLLGNNGWDPFLEDTASLWLLHWNLLKAPCHATTWHYAFNVFNKHTFTSDDLLFGLTEYRERFFPLSNTAKSSLISDVNCLIRMYTTQNSRDGFKEDSLDSPFCELQLIKNYSGSKQFAMNLGPKPGLVHDIITAACLDFASSFFEGAKTISISRLLYEEGSPGLCFKIRENELYEAIDTVASRFHSIALSETAGLMQLSYNDDPAYLSRKVLNEYYNRRG